MMDKVGNKTAQLEIAMIKVCGAEHGAEDHRRRDPGVTAAPACPTMRVWREIYAGIRTLRLADGPDEVHNRAIARLELRKYANSAPR